MNDLKGSFFRKPWAICLAVALVATVSASTTAWSQEDITDSAFPHTADSVIFEWYHYYAPENVSNNTFGLYYGSWHSGDIRTGELFPHWVQIDLGVPHAVVQLNILAFSENFDFNLRLKDFRFEGSNNGVDFTPIHQNDLQYANRHEWQTFLFENSTAYQFYRLFGLNNWVESNNWEQMIIEEWEMFEEPVTSRVPDGGVAAKATLFSAVPNPFNPQTTIAFDLPKQTAVRLAVYDVSGRLVDVLLDGDIATQGRNEVVWRGRDMARQVVSAGVYFYRLEAGSFSETKRMVLVK